MADILFCNETSFCIFLQKTSKLDDRDLTRPQKLPSLPVPYPDWLQETKTDEAGPSLAATSPICTQPCVVNPAMSLQHLT
ncbi:hypothetical protein RN001_002210 [Aquatica leii]|uniref:Uncharacterized protein n=1 Tax=Aquatica leii TaxID=1421715 RepID=A0AAN7PGR5_9COLE|nr:hypothetical protein RN001_002210 [Aquatica leii]